MSCVFCPSSPDPSLTPIVHRRAPLSHRLTPHTVQILPESVPENDAQALYDLMDHLHAAPTRVDLDRALRQLALAWEDYFLPKFPVPFFQVRVADVRATGGSLSTALELYDEVRAVCNAMWGGGVTSSRRCYIRSMRGRRGLRLPSSCPSCAVRRRALPNAKVSRLHRI